MSFLQMDLPAEQVADKTVRRALINAIVERTPTGPGRGHRSAREARKVGEALGEKVAIDGASPEVLNNWYPSRVGRTPRGCCSRRSRWNAKFTHVTTGLAARESILQLCVASLLPAGGGAMNHYKRVERAKGFEPSTLTLAT